MERSLVKRPTEEWCAYRDQFGMWRKSSTRNTWTIPDQTQIRLFKTEKQVDDFLNSPTPQN